MIDDSRPAEAGGLSTGRKINLVALLIIEVLVALWSAALYISVCMYGSVSIRQVTVAGVIATLLALTCFVLTFRARNTHPVRAWLLPPALLAATLLTLVAVSPGATWAARYYRVGEFTAEYSFTPVGCAAVGIALTDGAVWLACQHSNAVVRVDTERMERDVEIPVGSAPVGLVASGDTLWVSNGGDGTVSRVVLRTNEVATIQVGSKPFGIALGEHDVWVSNHDDGTVSRIDPALMKEAAVIQVGRNPTGLSVGFGCVWVPNFGDGSVSRIDATTNLAVATIPVGKEPACTIAGYGSLWVSDFADGAVTRIDPERNEASAVIPVGGRLVGLTIGTGLVWVVDAEGSALFAIDPETNSVVGSVKLGKVAEEPQLVVFGDETAWVSNLRGSLQCVRLYHK